MVGNSRPEADSEKEILSSDDKSNLLKLARKVVTAFARNEKIPSQSEIDFEISDSLAEPRGVFVTLFKKIRSSAGLETGPRSDKELRGCIGYIYPIKPLFQAVIDNALGASSKDYRFSPLKENELEDIELEISVLTPLRKVDSYEEIEIGKHGVVFYLHDRQSVFLPHVAPEFGWNREETLEQLAMKAGLDKNAWKNSEAKFDVFESIMFEED